MTSTENTISILLVEDDPIDRKAIARTLKKADMEIVLTAVTSIVDAVAALRTERFDCALLDWYLPDGTGADFLERASSLEPTLPVIVLTGAQDTELANAALAEGAQDYLIKGFYDVSSIVRSIRYAIERKKSEQLRARIVKVERLRSIGQLAAGVAHEINNPAGWIMANLDFMSDIFERVRDEHEGEGPIALDPEDAKDLRELLMECRDGISRVSDIVRALRAYAEASRTKVETIDIGVVLDQALQLVNNELREHVTLTREFEEELPRIDGDHNALVQALVNVLMNASESITRAGPADDHEIRISTSYDGNYITILIEDTGEGVKPEHRLDAFQPFFASPRGGTGMGLAVVHDVITQHNGSVRFLSAKRGAKLEIRIPTLLIRSGEVTAALVAKERLRILIIDGEPHMQRMFSRLFGEHHDVEIVQDLDVAIKLLRGDDMFDGILINLLRLEQHIGAFQKILLEEHPEHAPRVIVCAAGAVEPKVQVFIEQANARALAKPFDLDDLQEVLTHWSELRQNS